MSSFPLDKYPVTVGRVRQYVAAWNAGGTPVSGSGKHTYLNGGQGLANSYTPGTYEPGWVSWYAAYAFCTWDGGVLPSSAELEYAEAGGAQELEYPWGATTPGTVCPGTGCTYAIYGDYFPDGMGKYEGPTVNIAPVGTATAGAGRWGQLDLLGDLAEWTMDSTGAYEPCTDCARLPYTTGDLGNKLVQGAGYDTTLGYLYVDNASSGFPGGDDARYGVYDVGFRCSRAP